MPTINDIPKDKIVDLKTKTVIIHDNGLFCELGKTLSKFFKKVYYYMPWKNAFPKSNQYIVAVGLEGVERIYDFWDYVDKADIIIFPDVYDGDLQKHLVSIGKNVWGGRKGEEMELYRDDMKEHMKKLGLYVHPYKKITGIKALREYLKTKENVYIKCNILRGDFETFKAENYRLIEPKLDELEYNLGAMKTIKEFIVEESYDGVEAGVDLYSVDGQFPTETLIGIEVKDLGYVGKVLKYNDISEKITDFNSKISSTLKKYGYRGFMSTEVRISKDLPPYMVDACFSSDTEILTQNGWKLFTDITIEDKFATMNILNKKIEYQYATDYIVNEHKGKMFEFSNKDKSIECLITPNHLVLRTDRYKKKLFKERADSVTDKGFIPRTAIWKGEYTEYFEIPEYHNEWDWNKGNINNGGYKICTKIKHEPCVKIRMEDWAEFLGWYLSEGSTSQGSCTQISQEKYPEKVKVVLDRLPFKYSYNGKIFRIYSTQLTQELIKFGLCNEKYVPYYIKSSTPSVIRKFLNAFNWGDGSRKGNAKLYFSTSKVLCDDIQELIFKCGSVANISIKQNKGTVCKIRGKNYRRRYDSYVVYEHSKFRDFWFETKKRRNQYIKEIDYSGKVYCVTVPNGTIYVRRNGKPFWSSNCMRMPSPPNELWQIMYKNLGDIIWYGAQGYLIDPITETKFGVEALIHSSWADKNWQPIGFPPEYRDNIKLRNACVIDGKYYCAPQVVGLPEIGGIVCDGNTLDEAVEKVKKIAESIEGYYLEAKVESIDKAKEQFEELEKMGVKIL